MRKRYWIPVLMALVLVLSVYAAACGDDEATTTTAAGGTETTATAGPTETLKIGAMVSLSTRKGSRCRSG